MFRLLDLFSGIGGFSLAASGVWGASLEIVSFCEKDSFCRQVLGKHWPDVPIVEDIKSMEGNYGTIDLITGGFPCQPYSVAGRKLGRADDRALWPEMLRVIGAVRPRWVIGENVAGIVKMELEAVCASLEVEGYAVWPVIIPACSVGAPHRRDRVWILAHAIGGRDGGRRDGDSAGVQCPLQIAGSDCDAADAERKSIGAGLCEGDPSGKRRGRSGNSDSQLDSDAVCDGLQGVREQRDGSGSDRLFCGEDAGWEKDWHEVAAEFCRVDDGVSHRVDRLKSLGNAIVPRVAEEIMRCIEVVDGFVCMPRI